MSNLRFSVAVATCVCIHSAAPRHFKAYAVSSAGNNLIVDPRRARYDLCNENLVVDDKSFWWGWRNYTIYRHQHLDDSMDIYFAYQLRDKDSVALSITVMPMDERDRWYVLLTWEDSTKAFKATLLF